MRIEFYWIAVAVITVLSSARVTRLLTYDQFPPVLYLRTAYENWTDVTPRRRGWQLLAMCGYCMSFWVTLAVVLWGYFTDFDTVWFLVNSIFGASYAAAMVVAHDGDV